MTRYAVTGPVGLTTPEADRIYAYLRQLRRLIQPGDQFVAGGAYGVDTYVARHAVGVLGFNARDCALFLPAADYNEIVALGFSEAGWRLVHCKRGKTPPDSYMKRNDALVAFADVLWAFPRSAREEQRSGTWATVRRARKRGRTIYVFPLDGSPPWIEGP